MTEISLGPTQQAAFSLLCETTKPVMCVLTQPGMGATTLLQALHRHLGGVALTMADVVQVAQGQHSQTLEESLLAVLTAAFRGSSTVLIDDWHLLPAVVERCGSAYPRIGYLSMVAVAIAQLLEQDARRRLVVVSHQALPDALQSLSQRVPLVGLSRADYAHFCREFLPATTAAINTDTLNRFAPGLNVSQLKAACTEADVNTDTEALLEIFRSHCLVSNVELEEVAAVRFEDLAGIDDVVEQLLSHVVFPLEDDVASQKYGLRPKRGVLLLGPPGTGKTTIGKALAHRLRGKFFLIDGTIISGTRQFYYQIQSIIDDAIRNAPSVVFIDDSDVIFEDRKEHGLYRYLLTILDGMESASLQRVCIVLTAMSLEHIPPALIRSGRVELWLETRLPDEAARKRLIERQVADLPAELLPLELGPVVAATAGMTPADVKRIVNDAKLDFAWAVRRGCSLHSFGECLQHAAKALQSLRERFHAATSHAGDA